ncbi:hypothetical protein KVL94_00285 [Helicobacter pylori]|nr:hypothetical protein KVL94_00285 [Helicobacter pylori]
MGSFFSLGKSSNDTQENPKDAQKSTNFQEKHTKPTETTELVEKNKALTTEKENLTKEKTDLTEKNKALSTDKDNLTKANTELKTEKENLTKDKENLTKDKAELQKQVQALEQSQQVLKNEKAELLREKDNLTKDKTELTEKNKALTTEKTELNNKITGLATEKENLTKERDNLTKDKENLTTELSTAKSQAEKTSQKLNELEQRHAPYQKLEKLYEVFLEVKDRLNFRFLEETHSAMDLIVHVLSDSKYYLESLYNKASQELSDKRSDKGEKLAELFDLLFEYIKDSKFERLKEPSAYDHSCKTLYPEQNASQKMQRVVLRGYTYDKKIACHTIVDMGS